VDLVDPIVTYLGVESGDYVGHKRFLSLFAGGMLPIISLSFLHMLVKFEEEEKKKGTVESPKQIDIEGLSKEAGKLEKKIEDEKYSPTKEDLLRLEEELIKLNEQKFGNLKDEVVETPLEQETQEIESSSDS
jgi:hypothetical protein